MQGYWQTSRTEPDLLKWCSSPAHGLTHARTSAELHTTATMAYLLECSVSKYERNLETFCGDHICRQFEKGVRHLRLAQVKDLEKQQSRLKEVFKTQVSNFREACYLLFGYRVDMASQVCSANSSPAASL